MNETRAMQEWIQGCLDADDSGYMTLEHCDGVPGSCALYYLGTELRCRETDVEGNTLARYRCHFQLRRVSIGSAAGAAWMSGLNDMFAVQHAKGYAPQFSDLPGCRVTAGDVRQLRCDSDGTAEYAADLYGEYDVYYPRED